MCKKVIWAVADSDCKDIITMCDTREEARAIAREPYVEGHVVRYVRIDD